MLVYEFTPSASKFNMDTHDLGDTLPAAEVDDRSTIAGLFGEAGDPLLRTRLAAGSRSLAALFRGDEEAVGCGALAIAVKEG